MIREGTTEQVRDGAAEWSVVTGDGPAGLLALGRVDHVITDPPYDAKTHKGARYGFRDTSSEIPFDPIDPAVVAPALLSCARRWVLAFCSLEMFGAYRDAAGAAWVRAGLWRRINGVPQFSGDRPGQPAEGIAIMHNPDKKRWNGNGRHAIWDYPIVCGGPHPTTKPVGLMVDLVRDFTDPGELIADPFCGGGTTVIACLSLGRRCVAWEERAEYADIARERIRAWCSGNTVSSARAGQTTILDRLGAP